MRTTLLCAFLVGCGGDDPDAGEADACAPRGQPTLAIGGGAGAYEPLRAGDPIELVHGPQGGYHLEVGLAGTHLDAESLVSGFLHGSIGGDELATSAPWLEFRCNTAAGEQQSWGTLLIYDALPEDLHGRMTVIDAEVTDAAGTVVTASIDLEIVDPQQE